MTLVFNANVQLPKYSAGGFDHGDVNPSSGRVFVSHTANGTVDVVDGTNRRQWYVFLPSTAQAAVFDEASSA
jgi:hypothetical protein